MIPFSTALLSSLVLILTLGSLPSPGWLILLLVSLLVAVALTRLRSLALGCLVAILMLAHALLNLSASQLKPSGIGTDLLLVVRISGIPTQFDRALRFEAQILDCLTCVEPLGPERVSLNWYGATPALQAGDIWRLTVRLKPITSLLNPGGFDRVAQAAATGVHARGHVRDPAGAQRLSEAEGARITSLRQQLAAGLSALPSANAQVALVQALTLGIRDAVDNQVWQVLRQSGTAHLLAISGLHITLVAGWAWFLLYHGLLALTGRQFWPRWLNGRLDARLLALAASLMAAMAYALLAGFGLPAQRAVIMLAVWVLVAMRARVMPMSLCLSLALVLVLLHQPLAVMTVGLWLSFGTVAALVYLHAGQQRPSRGEAEGTESAGLSGIARHWLARVSAALQTHVRLGLLLLPVTAWFFHSGSLVAPLANLLAVPWVGIVVVPLCLATVLFSVWLPSLAGYCLFLAQAAIDLLLTVLGWLVRSPAAAVSLAMPSPAVMGLCLLGVLLSFSPRGLKLRWLAIPLLLPALLFNLQRPAVTGFEAHVLDVGQGLAVLVFSGRHTLLFDTGGRLSSRLSMFEAVVMPFLHASGRRRIDTLVISHTDQDHAYGVEDVLHRFPDIRLISSAPLSRSSDSGQGRGHGRDERGEAPASLPGVERCEAGMQWQQGETVFAFLHPGASDIGSDNDRSCVLLIHHGARRVLLTGDIEAAAEARLAARLRAAADRDPDVERVLRVDLMTAPHHGSRSSSTAELLSVIQPEHVVFPAGRDNRYGFPHVDVQSRYLALGVTLFTTGTEGAVSFSSDRSGVGHSPSSWWHSHRRFWHGIFNTTCFGHFPDGTLWWRLLSLAHEGQKLCGKLSLRAAG